MHAVRTGLLQTRVKLVSPRGWNRVSTLPVKDASPDAYGMWLRTSVLGTLAPQRNIHGVPPFAQDADKEKDATKDHNEAHAMTLGGAAKAVYRNVRKGAHTIPGVPIYPFVGSRPALWFMREYDRLHIHLFYDHCFDKYGPIFKICHPGGGNQVFIREAEDVRTLFMNKHVMERPERAHFEAVADIRSRGLNVWFKHLGIALSSGQNWASVRGRFNDLLLKSSLEKEFALVDEVTLNFMERIAQVRMGTDCRVPAHFLTELKRWAIEAAHYSILGLKSDDMSGPLLQQGALAEYMRESDVATELMEVVEFGIPFWKYFNTTTYNNLEASMFRFMKFIMGCVDKRVHELEVNPASARGTILEILLKENSDSAREIFANVHDILGAGVDVTPRHTAKVIYALGRNPHSQEKLREEVMRVMGPDPKVPMTLEHSENMPYLKAFVKETLRMYATSNTVSRKLVEPLLLRGYEVPPGWTVAVAQHSMGMLEHNVKEPQKFMPERFIGDNEYTPKRFGYLPFSFGKRQCVGRKYAEATFRNLAARLVQRYRVDMQRSLPTISCITVQLKGDLDFQFYDLKPRV